jgi:hypothetical protein
MKLFFLFAFILLAQFSQAQKITTPQLIQLKQLEQEIKKSSTDLVEADDALDRYRADSFFTRGLVKALKTPNSFYYNFDSIKTISKIYAPDSSFKIFTWQLMKDFTSVRQKGAIQMRTEDGSLKLIPLIDNSDNSNNPFDSVRSNQRWIGAIYYKIILTKYNSTNIYTLLGYDDNDEKTNRKWMEVLTFDKDGVAQFGGRYFQYPNDDIKPKQPAFRFCLEYKKEAKARLNFDTSINMIVFDHLTSEEKNPARRQSLIPDGDFEGFKWIESRWVYVSKLFDYKVDMQGIDPILGNAPTPAQLKDNNGKSNEKILDEISRKNGAPIANPYKVDDKKKKKENPKQKEEY